MIRLNNVHRIYGTGHTQVHALKGIDMHIKKGEFVSIMGASGSGKSTLLHIIGVIDRQTRGSVIINNVDVDKLKTEQRTAFRLKEIGFVFQFYSLLPELTALENAYLPHMLYGYKRAESKQNGAEALRKLGLGERLDHFPHELSGGEQQRVAIARALVNKPEIVLADEPTASLDSTTSQNVMNTFRKLSEEIKQTIILITHEEELGKQADRGIWLKDGLISREKRF
jgi:putative ABC transport system ATP-binding protein